MNRILFIFLVAFPFSAFAQAGLSTKSNKAIELYTEADNYRVRGQHAEAIDLLNQAIAKDKKFVEAYYRLGLVYMTTKNYSKAIENFEKGLELTNEVKKQKVFWYDLGETYLLTGQYDKATATLTEFVKVENQNKQKLDRASLMLKNATFAKSNQTEKAKYQQRKLSDTVNCFAMQYFPVLTADQQELIFTRRLVGIGDDDEDLVVSRKDANGRWYSPVSISKNINSKFNEGTCTISADGRKLIFTSCSGRRGFGSCDLFESTKIGMDWSEPVNLGPNVNSFDWESQPSLSADGRTLYFVSDRKGGYGRRDIWYSTLDDQGQWTKTLNLGTPVNTQYEEYSPFIHVNGKTLYFASNGLVGFGGFDLFFSERLENGWSLPENVGSPINDHEDQFSLFITADGKKGYYSHEEMTASGIPMGRLYEVQIPENQQIKYRSNYVKGTVKDKKTGKELRAKIELFDINKNKIVSLVHSDSLSGEYLMVLTQGSEYVLYVNKKGYLFQSLNFNYSDVSDFDPLTINIELDPALKGSVSVLKNIFFDVDKFDLKEKSITELEKIVQFLTENPQIRVEISGHTDNTGSAAYNQQLSEKRAKSVYSYIVGKNINPSRLAWKGYGSSKPIQPNDTEEGRQQNRRIEFTIR
jgi:outer membrane protein OmpA-like peptidoglycan-associated protein/outer membrane protein assembly factor BamD (BamD/ComL family)